MQIPGQHFKHSQKYQPIDNILKLSKMKKKKSKKNVIQFKHFGYHIELVLKTIKK